MHVKYWGARGESPTTDDNPEPLQVVVGGDTLGSAKNVYYVPLVPLHDTARASS